MYKLTYRTVNPNGAPYFLTKEETFPTRGAMNHLAFAAASQFKEWDGDPKAILVLTSRINGRRYKKKSEIVGAVTPRADGKRGERWRFRPGDFNLEADTLAIISDFLSRMNAGTIRFDPKKGELELL